MNASDVPRAVAATVSLASSLGLRVDDAVVLHDSNRIAVRLLPCDVLARVTSVAHEASAAFEVEVARRLAGTASPIAELEPRVAPRVHVRDGFAVTLWRYYEPVAAEELAPAEYAEALQRLHAGMRELELAVPHLSDRVGGAQRALADPELTPELPDADRDFLSNTVRDLLQAIGDRGAEEQPLHGEPHPGNLLRTKRGLLFIDLETCCRGPVEFDLAHAPDEVGAHYPATDPHLLRECRLLARALVVTWRWEANDRLPNGRRLGIEGLSQLRASLARPRIDPGR